MNEEMKNPFPGMNPWLEDHWHSVHARFLTYACDQIAAQLPPGLAALTEERVAIESFREDFKRNIVPDVGIHAVLDRATPPKAVVDSEEEGGVAVAKLPTVVLPEPVERSIHIVDGSGELITAIEALSGTNKQDARARQSYLSKQRGYLQGGVNLVEIDLISRGTRVFVAPDDDFGEQTVFPYGVCVYRASSPTCAAAAGFRWSDRLPRIEIPLREQDAEALLDIQEVVDQCYERGRYAYLIDYTNGPNRRLPEPVQKWAEQLLKEKSLR